VVKEVVFFSYNASDLHLGVPSLILGLDTGCFRLEEPQGFIQSLQVHVSILG
jgi:hypothetical protein